MTRWYKHTYVTEMYSAEDEDEAENPKFIGKVRVYCHDGFITTDVPPVGKGIKPADWQPDYFNNIYTEDPVECKKCEKSKKKVKK
jgi:hypothetical protein